MIIIAAIAFIAGLSVRSAWARFKGTIFYQVKVRGGFWITIGPGDCQNGRLRKFARYKRWAARWPWLRKPIRRKLKLPYMQMHTAGGRFTVEGEPGGDARGGM